MMVKAQGLTVEYKVNVDAGRHVIISGDAEDVDKIVEIMQRAEIKHEQPDQAAHRRSNRLRRALEKIITEYNFGTGKKNPYALVEIATLALTKDATNAH